MANVFISHRKSDRLLAERLSSELSKNGHDVWLDEWKINLGDSIVEKINEGLEGASYLIVCYSTAGVMSPWMSREWMSTLARQLNAANVKVIPAMLSGGNPPAILADIKYANLVTDWSHGVADILTVLR